MQQANVGGAGANRFALDASIIQFYSIELMPTADGRVAVGIMATVCERDGELEGVDLGSHRVRSIDDALAIIRDAVTSLH